MSPDRSGPDPIVPDTKDWTWVLLRPCSDCGLDTGTAARESIAGQLRRLAEDFGRELTSRADVRARPRPDVWSPLEYGCHVRDVFRRFDDRLRLMLQGDGPQFANWDQDATAIEDRYAEQDPVTVAAELQVAAGAFADRLDGVHGEQWQRTGMRSDGAVFTVETLARYLLHDPVHHYWDITGRRAG